MWICPDRVASQSDGYDTTECKLSKCPNIISNLMECGGILVGSETLGNKLQDPTYV